MKTHLMASILAVSVTAFQPVLGQESLFPFTTLNEGLDTARESDRIVMVYLYGEEVGGFSVYDRMWSDPLVAHYVEEMVVGVAINVDSEEGESFVRHLRKRIRTDAGTPGIYFFSDTGRSLGNVQGTLDNPEAPGRLLLALGAADYARHTGQRYSRRHWYR